MNWIYYRENIETEQCYTVREQYISWNFDYWLNWKFYNHSDTPIHKADSFEKFFNVDSSDRNSFIELDVQKSKYRDWAVLHRSWTIHILKFPDNWSSKNWKNNHQLGFDHWLNLYFYSITYFLYIKLMLLKSF